MMRTQKQTRTGRSVGLALVAAFIGVPLAEIALLVQVGGRIGLGPTLALIVLTAVIGAWMLRHQGFGVLMRAQRQMTEGALPVVEVFEGLCLVIAGALLLTPGFLTDALGAILLVPAVRRRLYRAVADRIAPHVVDVAGGRAAEAGAGPTIEGVFEDQSDDAATDRAPADRMPPPRGSWERHP